MTTIDLTARLQALDTAITAANAQLPAPQAATWLAQLNAERDALNAAPDAAKDDTAFHDAAVLWARTLHSAQAMLDTLRADPVYLALGTPPTTILSVAQAVLSNPNRRSVWGSTPGLTATMLDELYQEGHRWWLNQPEATRPPLSAAEVPLNTIAVLLPVTIETRFYPPDKDHPAWRVRVRVSPDDISVDRHRPKPTGFEIQALGDVRAAWQRQAPGMTLDVFLTNTDPGRALWRTLCDRFTPARAAWLVTTTAGKDLATVPTDDDHHPVRVAGFPDRIEVWVILKQQPVPQKIGEGKPVQRDRLVFDLPRDDADAWWNSWDTASAVGVGIECPLAFDPAEIETLYVVGLSGESPAGLFADKVASGDFAAIEPGTPTNTVHGAPAVDLATDPGTWGQLMARELQLAAANGTHRSEHSSALTGRPDALPLYPAPDFDHETLNRILVGALYPALWGHALKDIWGLGPASHTFARWMFSWVRTEGHLLPIRIGDQPYGVIPATSLQNWKLSPLDGSDAAVEPPIVAAMNTLRRDLAARAEARGTTKDADTSKLVTLVARTPTSVGYSYQAFEPEELIESLLASIPGGGFDADHRAKFRAGVERRYRPGETVRGGRPQRFYLAMGDRHDIAMPVALPFFFPGVPPEKAPHLDLRERITRFIDVLGRLQKIRGMNQGVLKEQLSGVLPDSLLFRLLLQSVLHVCADVAQASILGGGDGPRLQPLSGNPPPVVWEWAARLSLADSGQLNIGIPAGQTYRIVGNSVETLIKILQEVLDRAQATQSDQPLVDLARRLERVTSNTLDTAATRIDPFSSALAWRRLTTLRADPTTDFRLGIYGWVEQPKTGKDGPLPGGLLHAPSQAQLVTSIILRDRYLTEQGSDGGAGKAWQMSITSKRVRMAEEIAEEVRLGVHIREALGRRAEAILNDSALVREFRTALAPMRAADPDPFQVCDGEKVLRMLAEGTLPAPVQPTQQAQLQEWQDAMDVYADLLVAQGVYQATTRRADAASGTMNAAAGFGRPPELEVIQTPRAGQSVLSSLLAVLPFVDMPPLDQNQPQESHPAQLADASVAAYVDSTFGPAADWHWTFSVKGQRKGAGGQSEDFQQTQSVALPDLGMVPSDAVLFPPDKLSFALGQIAMDQVAAGITDLLGITIDGTLATPDPERHRVAREVVAVLGGKPFEFHQLHIPDSRAREVDITTLDQDIRANLLVRLRALVAAAKAVVGVLSDPAQAEAGLRLALRWGIAPIDRTMSPADRALQAQAALQARLQKAQDFLGQLDADVTTPNAAGKTPQAAASQIAEAINDLAAPEGQLALLSAVNRDQLRNYESDRPIQPAPRLDEDWLTVLAPVRGRLARLEALQLETLRITPPAGFTPLVAFANTPGDPWQQQAVVQNRERVRQGQAQQPPRLIAAYGTANAWDGTRVAVGLIDSWSETVPDPRHTTQAGFHFNAPGARAPQAVLLAVPPVVDQLIDTATVVDILRETRELAHARMATLEDLGDDEAVLPMILLSTPDPWNSILLDPNPFPNI